MSKFLLRMNLSRVVHGRGMQQIWHSVRLTYQPFFRENHSEKWG